MLPEKVELRVPGGRKGATDLAFRGAARCALCALGLARLGREAPPNTAEVGATELGFLAWLRFLSRSELEAKEAELSRYQAAARRAKLLSYGSWRSQHSSERRLGLRLSVAMLPWGTLSGALGAVVEVPMLERPPAVAAGGVGSETRARSWQTPPLPSHAPRLVGLEGCPGGLAIRRGLPLLSLSLSRSLSLSLSPSPPYLCLAFSSFQVQAQVARACGLERAEATEAASVHRHRTAAIIGGQCIQLQLMHAEPLLAFLHLVLSFYQAAYKKTLAKNM